jgi:hypothetical protein
VEAEFKATPDAIETALRRPPFMFAKRHGVLVAGEKNGKTIVMHRGDTDSLALVELRRFMQQPLSLQLVDDEHFKNLLAGAYEQDTSEAMQRGYGPVQHCPAAARTGRPAGK